MALTFDAASIWLLTTRQMKAFISLFSLIRPSLKGDRKEGNSRTESGDLAGEDRKEAKAIQGMN